MTPPPHPSKTKDNMTNKEREFASIGWNYCEGIEEAKVIVVPETGRQIIKNNKGLWECQPHNDNYWKSFENLIDAAKFAMGKK